MEEAKVKIVRAQAGGQERFVRSNVDVCFFGGTLGGGKTFGAILAQAEPTLDPNFRGIFIRKSLGDIKTTGSIYDTFKDVYGDIIKTKISENPRFTFPSGAYIEARQVQNEDKKKIIEEWKGVQADLVSWEELTSYEWYTFMYIMSRCRGRGKWTGKIRATLNPKKSHWVRKWLDWYIGADGYIIPERDGVVRYFYLKGETVEDLVWGNTKEEVYKQCSVDINEKIASLGGNIPYQDMIKSFTFYKGSLAENRALLDNNPQYVGSVASTGGKTSKILIQGNWNIDEDDDTDDPIPYHVAESVFRNDPMVNNDKWITADLADSGSDNTVIFVWNGLHIIDYSILCTSTPKMNAEKLMYMADKHGIPDTHIIYDAIRATYINDYIEFATPFMSYMKTMGKYGRMYRYLKDECYARLVEVIKRGMLSFDDVIANKPYVHKNIHNPISIKQEFCEECSVVRFKEMPGGKMALFTKKDMNAMLGKGRSMDVLDPIAMRMMPLLPYEYGEELLETEVNLNANDDDEGGCDIYSDSTWA